MLLHGLLGLRVAHYSEHVHDIITIEFLLCPTLLSRLGDSRSASVMIRKRHMSKQISASCDHLSVLVSFC